MSVRARVRRLGRNLQLAVHLMIDTSGHTAGRLANVWRDQHRQSRPASWRREIITTLGYFVGCVVNGLDSFLVDGARYGRRARKLPPQARRKRRARADLRRRQVGVLLAALGGTPQAVQASLTRHWQVSGISGCDVIEDYLFDRLQHRDQHATFRIQVWPWVCLVGDTWITTPRAVRRYLQQRRTSHERQLTAAGGSRPRRGVRVIPDSIRTFDAAASR
jgi:hypothetical protein